MNEEHEAVVIGAGQSGLAAAWALQHKGLPPLVVEAGLDLVGAWPSYYDSLTLFSPARYSGLPGLPFPGDARRYPHRDEVIDYLRTYAKFLGVQARTGTTVTAVDHDGQLFVTTTSTGELIRSRLLVCATGGFGSPYRPALPGLDTYAGRVLHASDYRAPAPFAGQRVIVVGAGNSAIQIAVELAEHAHVTLATRTPVKYVPQRPLGRDLHFWFKVTGIDAAPVGRFLRHPPTVPVFDSAQYEAAIQSGRPHRRAMFTGMEGDQVLWPDGTHEAVDTVILATGYRPDLGYLERLGALDEQGHPAHRGGVSTTHGGLGFVGLEWQRSLSSASLRGVGRDAKYVVRRLARHR